LRIYYPDQYPLEGKIKKILSEFQGQKTLKYNLTKESYLLLTHEERNIPPYKRYAKSPLPFISNMDKFRCSLGEYNEELEEYGLQTRKKYNDTDPCDKELGTHIFLVHYNSKVGRCNKYLKRQYKRLEQFKEVNEIDQY